MCITMWFIAINHIVTCKVQIMGLIWTLKKFNGCPEWIADLTSRSTQEKSTDSTCQDLFLHAGN